MVDVVIEIDVLELVNMINKFIVGFIKLIIEE